MKVLQLCHKPPYPSYDGGSMAMHSLSKGLAENGVELKVLSFATYKHPSPIHALNQDYIEQFSPEYMPVAAKTDALTFLASLFSKWPFVFYRYYSKSIENKLIELLKTPFDAVVFDGLYTAVYLDVVLKHSHAKCVYRAHNVEHSLWQQKAQNQSNSLNSALFNYFAKQVYSFEKSTLQKTHALAAISKTDQNQLLAISSKQLPAAHIPFGYIPPTSLQANKQNEHIGFIGALNWQPNIEALHWFLTTIWPTVLGVNPNAQFHVAGRDNTSGINFSTYKNLHYWGEVDDLQDFYNAVSVIVVPLKTGSGVRIKIIEALYQQKAVVSTTKGAEGLELKPGEHLHIADVDSDFATHIIDFLNNKEESAAMALSGQKQVEKEYHYLSAGKKMLNFLHSLHT